MDFSSYRSALTESLGDKRVKKNAENLMDKIKSEGHLKIWTLSADSNEYERYERLLEASNKHHLSVSSINSSLLSQGESGFQGSKSILLIHDPSEIRKAYSNEMENLARVRSLDQSMVNGYHSFNTVGIGQDKKLRLLGCVAYGGEGELSAKKQARAQMSRISQGLKSRDADTVLIHNMDRGFDDQDYFGFIDKELRDNFVIRLKLNRNSGLQKWDRQKQEEVNQKLKEADFAKGFKQAIDKFSWGKQVYHQASAHLEYDRYYLGEDFYSVVRVTLKQRNGRKIFKEPMLLVSNFHVGNEQMAWFIFSTYLKRSKIEGVFKFLKTELGWETFQVRDFVAIQHLIVLCYYIGGYFYEIEDQLTENEWMSQTCTLGGGKGKVTKVFFLRGLKKLAHYQQIKQFMEENNLSEQQLNNLFKLE